jgi:hypothetical protein
MRVKQKLPGGVWKLKEHDVQANKIPIFHSLALRTANDFLAIRRFETSSKQ